MTRSLLSELKRRNVLRAGTLYIGAAWALRRGPPDGCQPNTPGDYARE